MALQEFGDKQSYEEYYVSFNFRNVLLHGDTIESATVTAADATGADATSTLLDVDKQNTDRSKVFAWVRGGTAQVYKLTCKIVTVNGEKYEVDVNLEVAEL